MYLIHYKLLNVLTFFCPSLSGHATHNEENDRITMTTTTTNKITKTHGGSHFVVVLFYLFFSWCLLLLAPLCNYMGRQRWLQEANRHLAIKCAPYILCVACIRNTISNRHTHTHNHSHVSLSRSLLYCRRLSARLPNTKDSHSTKTEKDDIQSMIDFNRAK